jgi:hypothetical protein
MKELFNLKSINFRKTGVLSAIFLFGMTLFLNNSFPASASVQSVLSIAKGGTNANTAERAREKLGITDTVDLNSNNNQFPSSKAVYDFIEIALAGGKISSDNINFGPHVTSWAGGDLIYKDSDLSSTAANNKIKVGDKACATRGQGYTANSAADDSIPQVGCILPNLTEGNYKVTISTDNGANYSINAGTVTYKQTPKFENCDTTSMQTFSANAAACKAIIRQGQVIVLNDPRGNSDSPNGQKYRVKKMPDGNIWMIDNLKLGSTTSTTTLTPANTNIAANYTLPTIGTNNNVDLNSYEYCASGGESWTGGSFTGCGYLYNWDTAMAGNISDSGYSIAPRGWNMPKKSNDITYDGLIDSMVAAAANSAGKRNPVYGTTNYSNWSYINSAFDNVYSGHCSGTPEHQGATGYPWYNTEVNATTSYSMWFTQNVITFQAGYPKTDGRSIRAAL